MIAIQSNKKLQFPPASVGYVRMEIDLIQNKPNTGVYELRIIDTCFETVMERRLKAGVQKSLPPIPTNHPTQPLYTEDDFELVEVEKTLGTNTRFKSYTYAELRELSQMLTNVSSDNQIDTINELFLEGLLLTTQSECMQGISVEGKGMYFSEVNDWAKI